MNWLTFAGRDDPRPTWPLLRVLGGIATAGSPGVGIDHYSVSAYARTGGTLDELASTTERLGLRCTDVGVLQVGSGDTVARASSLAVLARTLGAHRCVTAFTAPPRTPLLDGLRASADVLAAAGVRLAIEFAPYSSLASMDDAVSVCERIGWDRCGLLLDIWHVIRSGTSWHELRGLQADQVALVHLSDAPLPVGDDLEYESRFRRLPPGTGTFPTSRFLKTLDEIEYDGVVSAEVLSVELRAQPPSEGAQRIVDALRRLGLTGRV